VKNVVGLGEVSASGLPGEVGVLVLTVSPQSQAASLGLRQGDVILKLGGQATDTLADLLRLSSGAAGGRVTVFRDQHEVVLGTL
jgi:S1-C subfamily serine protease